MTNNPSPTIHTPVKWTKPENGVLKLNVDTSVSLGAISFTMGLVIRDHAGVFVAGKMVCIAMITTTFEVEALAILESLHWLLTLNHDRVIIESDSLLSIRALQGSHDNLLEVGSILNACRIILDSRPETPTKPTKTEEPPKTQVQSRYETVPILRPSEYAIWKLQLQAVTVAGEAAKSVPKEKSDYTAEDITSIAKDAKVQHLLHSAIDNVMSNRVINCKTAKEIWDALETRCQGMDTIKKNRKTILTQEYEHFDSKANESLTDLYDRFVKLLNDLSLVNKEYDLEDSNLKFLLALPKCWDLKATTIRDNYNLDETTLDEIYGMLKTHELEIEQRSKRKGENDDDSESESLPETDVDEEMMKLCALMVKGITKIAYRKFRKGKKFSRKGTSSDKKNFRKSEGRGGKSDRGDYTNVKCYNCGGKGHISPDCKKVKSDKGKTLVTKKKSWTDTSDSESEENYALMANADKASAESSSEAAELKVPQTTYAFHTDDINELRRYLKTMFISYRDQTLTCERLTSENLACKKRNDYLKKGLVMFHQTQQLS
ncbi:hypothetical protein AgCh_034545 [Apium graveolens]